MSLVILFQPHLTLYVRYYLIYLFVRLNFKEPRNFHPDQRHVQSAGIREAHNNKDAIAIVVKTSSSSQLEREFCVLNTPDTCIGVGVICLYRRHLEAFSPRYDTAKSIVTIKKLTYTANHTALQGTKRAYPLQRNAQVAPKFSVVYRDLPPRTRLSAQGELVSGLDPQAGTTQSGLQQFFPENT